MPVGRKPIRGRAGLWSVRQTSDVLSLPLRATRTAATLYEELFPQPLRRSDYLEDADLLPIKALAVVQRTGLDLLWPDLITSGHDNILLRSVISNARQVWEHPLGVDQLMLLTGHGVHLAASPADRSVLFDKYGHQPVLTLPIGQWGHDIHVLVDRANRPTPRSA